MVQLVSSMAEHNLLEVPPVVEALLEGCLKREAADRLTFKQVIELTDRATRDGVPIKRRLEGERASVGAVAGAVAVDAMQAGAVIGGTDTIVSAGDNVSGGYASCDAELFHATDTIAPGSGYSTCVAAYVPGEGLLDQVAVGGYSQGFSEVAGATTASGYSQGFEVAPSIDHPSASGEHERRSDSNTTVIGTSFTAPSSSYIAGVDLAVSRGDADVPVLLEGSTVNEGGASSPSSSYIARFDLTSIVRDDVPGDLEGSTAEEGGSASSTPSSSNITGLERSSSAPLPNNPQTANVGVVLESLPGDDADGTRL
jgi:hypothetical protein